MPSHSKCGATKRRVTEMKAVVFTICAMGSLVAGTMANACGIEGSAVRSDGSKVDGTARISTSWNSSTAFPRNGWYELDLGSSACGASVTVYVNGNDGQRITLPSSGNIRHDRVVR